MFKEITAISKNYAICKVDTSTSDDLLNLNVIFEEDNKKILGEIDEINNGEANIKFMGEFHNGKYYDGSSQEYRQLDLNSSVSIDYLTENQEKASKMITISSNIITYDFIKKYREEKKLFE